MPRGGRAGATANLERPPAIERKSVQIALGLLGLLLAVAVWDLAVRTEFVDPIDVSSPAQVAEALVDLLGTATLWTDILETLKGAAIGLLVAAAVGIPLGTAMGLIPAVDAALRPTVEFLRPVPGITLIPLAILIWGQSITTVWFLVAVGCVWTLVIQSFYAGQAIDELTLDTARTLRLTRRRFIWSVVLPGTMPYLVTGLRIALTIALIAAISVELLIGVPGLGSAIVEAQNAGRLPEMYALVVIGGLLGILIQVAFSGIERYFLRWHESQRKRSGE